MARSVSGENILAEQNLSLRDVRLTGLQEAGVRLAMGVGLAGLIVIVVLAGQWIAHSPGLITLPAIPSDPSTAPQVITNTKIMIENHKALSEIALAGPRELLDLLVVTVLFPIFTAILGYIFGTNQRSTQGSD